MAFSLESLLESVIPSVLSGGGAAVSTIIAFFRDLRSRIETLEKRLGSLEDRNGIIFAIHHLEEQVRQLREDAQPARAGRLQSYNDLSEAAPWAGLQRRMSELEERIERLEGKLKKLVTEEDFEASDKARAAEIATVRTTLAEVKGLLQGLQSALGLIGHGKSRS